MWKWVYFNSPTIQAMCAILGIGGLFAYAWETRKIRKTTLAQSEASRRPFFVLEKDEGELRLKNVGAGIALAVEWCYVQRAYTPGYIKSSSVPPGLQVVLRDPMGKLNLGYGHVRDHGLFVIYTDTAGKRYWSEFTVADNEIIVQTGEAKSRRWFWKH